MVNSSDQSKLVDKQIEKHKSGFNESYGNLDDDIEQFEQENLDIYKDNVVKLTSRGPKNKPDDIPHGQYEDTAFDVNNSALNITGNKLLREDSNESVIFAK